MVVIDNGLYRQWLFLIVTFNMWNYLTCMSIYLGEKHLGIWLNKIQSDWKINETMKKWMLSAGARTEYPSRAPELTPPLFSGVRITRSSVVCVCFVDRCLYFWYFSFDLPRFTNFDYPFGIFKLFMKKIWLKLWTYRIYWCHIPDLYSSFLTNQWMFNKCQTR
jgi:hypothetical protein